MALRRADPGYQIPILWCMHNVEIQDLYPRALRQRTHMRRHINAIVIDLPGSTFESRLNAQPTKPRDLHWLRQRFDYFLWLQSISVCRACVSGSATAVVLSIGFRLHGCCCAGQFTGHFWPVAHHSCKFRLLKVCLLKHTCRHSFIWASSSFLWYLQFPGKQDLLGSNSTLRLAPLDRTCARIANPQTRKGSLTSTSPQNRRHPKSSTQQPRNDFPK